MHWLLHPTTSVMLLRISLFTLVAVTKVAAQEPTINSVAFNDSDKNIILYATTSDVDVTNLEIGPPSIFINTWNFTSSFMALMSYTYPSSNDPADNETDVHWAWLQTDMTVAWASEYPDDQEATGAMLTSTAAPLVRYTRPEFPTTTANLTTRIFQQTPALKSLLGKSGRNYITKLKDLLSTYEDNTNDAVRSLKSIPQASIHVSISNSTSDTESLPNGSKVNTTTTATSATKSSSAAVVHTSAGNAVGLWSGVGLFGGSAVTTPIVVAVIVMTLGVLTG